MADTQSAADHTYLGVVRRDHRGVAIGSRIEGVHDMQYCIDFSKESSKALPPHLAEWRGKTIPESEHKSMVFDISQDQTAEIRYSGHSFKPSMAIVTLPPAETSFSKDEHVGCETIFVQPVDGNRRDRFKVYSVPDTSIRCEWDDHGEIDLYGSSKASILIKDQSDMFLPVQEVHGTKRPGVVSCTMDASGQGEIWVISKNDYDHWTARYGTTLVWDPVRGEVESFTRDLDSANQDARSGVMSMLSKAAFTLLDWYG
ncbi:hypothetical protein V865_004122 [Kwoniella europaea PYCC6329]|uniref:Uncharacterized protein n=1 Tax=Kwoniella europaea PYCC6329 TaxID=1423913 RepID=A0AAX4KJX0_9TREE